MGSGGGEPAEVELTGGGRTAVSRRGDVVLRAAGPWSPAVHALLRHLEGVGFAGAPRVVGGGFDAAGRETLEFVEGEFVHPHAWSDAGAYAVGALLRGLHDATASFEEPEDARWQPWFGRELGGRTARVIGHCDTGPWNIVARDGLPVAFIDWEVAGPVDPLVELAQLCWLNAQLHDDDVAEMVGLPSAEERAHQLRLIADGYGLGAAERARLLETIVTVAVHDAAEQAVEARITPHSTDPEPLWGLAWRIRGAAWIQRNRELLARALH